MFLKSNQQKQYISDENVIGKLEKLADCRNQMYETAQEFFDYLVFNTACIYLPANNVKYHVVREKTKVIPDLIVGNLRSVVFRMLNKYPKDVFLFFDTSSRYGKDGLIVFGEECSVKDRIKVGKERLEKDQIDLRINPSKYSIRCVSLSLFGRASDES